MDAVLGRCAEDEEGVSGKDALYGRGVSSQGIKEGFVVEGVKGVVSVQQLGVSIPTGARLCSPVPGCLCSSSLRCSPAAAITASPEMPQ